MGTTQPSERQSGPRRVLCPSSSYTLADTAPGAFSHPPTLRWWAALRIREQALPAPARALLPLEHPSREGASHLLLLCQSPPRRLYLQTTCNRESLRRSSPQEENTKPKPHVRSWKDLRTILLLPRDKVKGTGRRCFLGKLSRPCLPSDS